MTMPTWISEFQALGTILTGAGVMFIAIQQYRIAARKLKLDLYQRRFEIFDAMRNLITEVFKNSKDNLELAIRLDYQKKAEARFLLDTEACNYLEHFVNKVSTFNNVREEIVKPQVFAGMPEEIFKIGTAQSERLVWMNQQYEPLVKQFERFLKLDHALGIGWRKFPGK